MKKRKTAMVSIAALSLFGLSSCVPSIGVCVYGPPPISDEEYTKEIMKTNISSYIDSLLSDNTVSYIPKWNQESFKGKWNYIDGVFLNSILNRANYYKDKSEYNYNKHINFLKQYVDLYIDEEGNFINYKNSSESGYTSGELDSVCESKILFDMMELCPNDTRYKKALDKSLNDLYNMPKCSGTKNYNHKNSYPNQIWLDGMYMYAPTITRNGKSEDLLDLIDQYKYIRNNMFDENKKLYYHGHDTTKNIFWADKTTGNSKSFWLRSMGWYVVSLVDVLDYYPEGSGRDYLISLLNEAIIGIMNYQDNDSKMFYQVVDNGDISINVPKSYLEGLKNTKYQVDGKYQDSMISNYLESSGSSMIAYTLLKASRLGYIDISYMDKGIEIFNAIYNHSFKDDHLNDICITAGLGPESKTYRDGSIEYYLAEPVGSDDAKGVGPFIMAYLEYLNTEE